jgi:hypothetical protein
MIRTVRSAALLVAALALFTGCPTETGEARPTAVQLLEVENNPNNVLSCWVRWITNEPATSRVEFGVEGEEPRWFIEHDELVTEHEIAVIGMHQKTVYDLIVSSGGADGGGHIPVEASYQTRGVPFDTATFEVTELRDDLVQPGWLLTNLAMSEGSTESIALVLDEQGEPVWYYNLGARRGRADVVVTLVDRDDPAGPRVLIGGSVPGGMAPSEVDLGGRVTWRGPEQPDGMASVGYMHHSFRKLDDGTYLALRNDFDDGLQDEIEIFDSDGETLWSWRTAEHTDMLGEEYVHGNAVFTDATGDVYFNSRNNHALYRIGRDDGLVQWHLGCEGDFEMLTVHDDPWPSHQHAPQLTDEGHVLLFDNGDDDRGYSRVVEYALDESAFTAELVWEYPGDMAEDPWYTTKWGDADRLANGNTLVTAAAREDEEDNTTARLFEVTADGTMAWELWVDDTDPDDVIGMYQAERIPVLVDAL